MSEYDDSRYIVVERGSGGFGNFVWGLLLGAGAALLFAPKSGKETRDELRDRFDELREGAEGRVRDLQENLTGTVDDVRSQVNEGLDSARRAIESGREAARASRDEMKDRLRESADAFQGGWKAAHGSAEAEPVADPTGEAPGDGAEG